MLKKLYWKFAIAASSLMVWLGPAVAGQSWTGCGVGAHLGYSVANTHSDITATGVGSVLAVDGLGSDSIAAGVSVSCDVQMDRIVVGGFADYTWADRETKLTLLGGLANATMSLRNQWTVGARAGVLVHNAALVYGLVGYSGMTADDLVLSGGGTAVSFSVPDFRGWVVGGGMETTIGHGLFLRGEYRYSMLDKETVALVPGSLGLDLEPDVHSVHVGIVWKFGAREVGLPTK